MNAKKAAPLPTPGSFPGYTRGAELFNAWARALKTHADGWNGLWSKLRSGDVEFADWSKALVGSVEAGFSFSEQLFLTAGGPSAPPWVVVALKSEVEVKILKAIDTNIALNPVPLTVLGPEKGQELHAIVRPISTYSIGISIAPDQASKLAKGDPPLQYIGLVFSEEYPEPVAIVSMKL